MIVAKSLDTIIDEVIEEMFPGHSRPDENNYENPSRQYPAPDHFICCDANVFIERKSLNPEKDLDHGERISMVAKEQGHPGMVFLGGEHEISKIIKTLPDPSKANERIKNIYLNKLEKNMRDAAKKFRDFDPYKRHFCASETKNLLVIADHSTVVQNTNVCEERIGNFMHKNEHMKYIHAVMYFRSPEYVFSQPDSCWCKVVIRKESKVLYNLLFHLAIGVSVKIGNPQTLINESGLRFLYL